MKTLPDETLLTLPLQFLLLFRHDPFLKAKNGSPNFFLS
jgi:hypothetical protein